MKKQLKIDLKWSQVNIEKLQQMWKHLNLIEQCHETTKQCHKTCHPTLTTWYKADRGVVCNVYLD